MSNQVENEVLKRNETETDGAGIVDDTLRDEIARRAYIRYCDRGCTDGSDVNDWLAAEAEVLAEYAAPPGRAAEQATASEATTKKAGGRA